MNILMHYFSVPKGKYISMVYNGKLSGLNEVIWSPHFYLHMVVSALKAV